MKPYEHFGRLMAHHRGTEAARLVAERTGVGARTIAEIEGGTILPTCKSFAALVADYRARSLAPMTDAAVVELVNAMAVAEKPRDPVDWRWDVDRS